MKRVPVPEHLKTPQQKHCLPWRVVTRSEKHQYPHIEGKNWYSYGVPVADLCLNGLEKEQARFIVRACNSHYKLLEACREALEDLTTGKWAGLEHELVEQLQRALTKATR